MIEKVIWETILKSDDLTGVTQRLGKYSVIRSEKTNDFIFITDYAKHEALYPNYKLHIDVGFSPIKDIFYENLHCGLNAILTFDRLSYITTRFKIIWPNYFHTFMMDDKYNYLRWGENVTYDSIRIHAEGAQFTIYLDAGVEKAHIAEFILHVYNYLTRMKVQVGVKECDAIEVLHHVSLRVDKPYGSYIETDYTLKSEPSAHTLLKGDELIKEIESELRLQGKNVPTPKSILTRYSWSTESNFVPSYEC
jgi:hypothetical protein